MGTQAGRKTRIAHVTSTLGMGGIETWLSSILPLMPKHEFDFEVLWIASLQVGGPGRKLKKEGIPILHCPTRSRSIFSARLRRMLLDRGYDIVHFHFAEGGIGSHFAAMFAWKLKRIMHLHNTRVSSRDGLCFRLVTRLLRKAAKRIPHLTIGNSRGTLNEYFGKEWPNRKDVTLLYLGVSPERFKPSDLRRHETRRELGVGPGEILIGHVGSYAGNQKNQEAVIETVAELKSRGEKAKALMIGSGARLEEMKKMARERGIGNECIFTGEREDVECVYPAMDVLLFPSRWEGYGLVSIEAQACGTPVVASDIPGLRESIVFPDHCRLVQDVNPAALADACLSLFGRRIIGEIPYPYTLTAAAESLADIYNRVQGI